jgi:hypothetical protein
MDDPVKSSRDVLVVLDPDFGEHLRNEWYGQAVWITMSPVNAVTVRSLWADAPREDHLTPITGFTHQEGTPAEGQLLAQLTAIDLHHGPFSTKTPYTALTVIGTALTESVRTALLRLGFLEFEQRPDRFVAKRSEGEAGRLRE